MARGEPPRRSELPAPYRSPWRGLAEALQAVAADLRLGLRSLLRRNLQGELPRPGVWPDTLAPLFWPLVLALVLGPAVVLLAMSRLTPSPPTIPAPAPPPQASADGSLRGASGQQGEDLWELGTGLQLAPSAAPALPSGEEPVSPPEASASSVAAATLQADDLATTSPDHGLSLAGDAEPVTAPELRLDPLIALLTQGDDADLLLAARPDPMQACVILTLSATAEGLPEAILLGRAEQWRQRALEAGYERLELRDGSGRLRGRQALVGSGMILLAPTPSA